MGSTAIGSIPLTGSGVYTQSPCPSATRSNHSSFPGTRRRKLKTRLGEEHDGHPPQKCSRDELLPCCGFSCRDQNRAKVHYDYDIISFAVNFHPNRATLWGLSGLELCASSFRLEIYFVSSAPRPSSCAACDTPDSTSVGVVLLFWTDDEDPALFIIIVIIIMRVEIKKKALQKARAPRMIS